MKVSTGLFSPTITIVAALIFLLCHSEGVQSAHVVFLHHVASYSHRVVSTPLAEKLISRGHSVTYIATDPSKIPNPKITDVVPRRLKKFMEETLQTDHGIKARLNGIPLPFVGVADFVNIKACSELLQSEELIAWLSTAPKVDLIYADTFPQCAYGLAYKLKAKLAIFTPFVLMPFLNDLLGIPDESSSIPVIDYRTSELVSLLERARNALTIIGWHFSNTLSTFWMERTLRENLDIPDMPSIEEMQKNISLVLMNSNFIDEHPRSLPPFVISVPGLHVKETHKPLSKDMEKIVNSGEGFVLVSLGTVVDTAALPQYVRETFFNAMKMFPSIRFIWRWNGEFPTDGPKNLYFSKWFEQQDLLAHPKIRAFIFQAGRPSAQEALANAVPMITFPVLADQDYNANRLQSQGVSINLEIGSLSSEQLEKALLSVMQNETYKQNALKIQKLFKDLPMKPVDTAVWWTEYILRHDDTSHLKPIARTQTWYQRRLLDVWILVSVILLCVSYVNLIAIRFVWRKYTLGKSTQKVKSS